MAEVCSGQGWLPDMATGGGGPPPAVSDNRGQDQPSDTRGSDVPNDINNTSSSSSAGEVIISNILCFLLAKIHHHANKPIKSLVVDFYSAEEIATAKVLLFEDIGRMKISGAPPLRKRRDNVNKSSNDIDDILSALSFLDEQRHLGKLRKYLSTSPDKMPAVRLAEGDLAVLLHKVDKLENTVFDLRSMITSLTKKVESLSGDKTLTSWSKPTTFPSRPEFYRSPINTSATTGNIMAEHSRPIFGGNHGISFAGVVAGGQGVSRSLPTGSEQSDYESDQAFEKVRSRKDKRNRSGCSEVHGSSLPNAKRLPSTGGEMGMRSKERRVGGSDDRQDGQVGKFVGRATGGKLKAAVRRDEYSPVAIFCVSNVSSEYSIEDIRQYCIELGTRPRYIHDISSHKFSAKAFKVAIGENDRNVFENVDVWPEKVIIRRWKSPTENNGLNDNHTTYAAATGASSSPKTSTNIFPEQSAMDILAGALVGTSRSIKSAKSTCATKPMDTMESTSDIVSNDDIAIDENLQSLNQNSQETTASVSSAANLADQLLDAVHKDGITWSRDPINNNG